MSFHEKSAWGSLVIVVLVFGWYVASLWSGAGDSPESTAFLLLRVTLAVVVAEAGFHILVATPLARRPEEAEKDERDKLVAWRAEGAGAVVLGGFVVFAIFYIVVGEAFFGPRIPLHSAHLLLLGLVLAEVYTDAYRIVLYRRGF